MQKTVLRKNKDNLDHMAIVKDYADGELSVSEIAQKHHTTSNNVGLIASRFWKSLTNMRESRLLEESTKDGQAGFDAKHALKELHGSTQINQEFLDLLSDPSANLLSDPEAVYAWTYVHSGDLRLSLKTSGLDIGLAREKKKDSRFSYDHACMLRGQYLNCKANIAGYIKELRETRLIDADVGKARIQSELIEQIEQLKSTGDTRNRASILRAIELLGKTVGAFVDRVEVKEVNASDALDRLIEMAQEAEVNPVPIEAREITQ